jgi:hypothetical protein
MGRAHITNGREENAYKMFVGKSEVKDHLGVTNRE